MKRHYEKPRIVSSGRIEATPQRDGTLNLRLVPDEEPVRADAVSACTEETMNANAAINLHPSRITERSAGFRLVNKLWPGIRWAKGPHGTLIATVTLTPGIAEVLLKHHNSGNRRMRVTIAKRYAALRISGGWGIDVDPLVISVDGLVLNGQHRCQSIVMSKKTDEMILVFNAPADVFEKLDRGIRRAPSDLLRTSQSFAAVTRAMCAIKMKVNYIEHEDLTQFADAYRDDIEWACDAIRGKGLALAPVRAVFAYAHSKKLYRQNVEELADDLVRYFGRKGNAVFSATPPLAEYISRTDVNVSAPFCGTVAAGIQSHCLGENRALLRHGRSNGMPFLLSDEQV